MTARVLNRRTHNGQPGAVYIGRPSPWGNPFKLGRDGSRDEVCDEFDRWARHSQDAQARWVRKNIGQLIGRGLLCFCAPQRCHGDTLLQMAREADQ